MTPFEYTGRLEICTTLPRAVNNCASRRRMMPGASSLFGICATVASALPALFAALRRSKALLNFSVCGAARYSDSSKIEPLEVSAREGTHTPMKLSRLFTSIEGRMPLIESNSIEVKDPVQ